MGLWSTVADFLFGRSGSNAPLKAKYDAAQTTTGMKQHWAAADALDADSANSRDVRQKLVNRSRYETNNNGHLKGITLTQANYVVGRGPVLRMQTATPGFNAFVESAWRAWSAKIHLARKLRTAIKAKVQDGEAFLLAKQNPGLNDIVKMDVVGIECDQVQSPQMPYGEQYRIDGIKFDEYGNPLWYDVLPYHPGGSWWQVITKPDQVPAKFVFHLFREDRPGQHRGIPETTPTLNLSGQSRRYREATIAAAENIASFSLFLRTLATPEDGADLVRPLSTMPIEKGMMVALPAGYEGYQPKAEQPTASYEAFTRAQLCEQARPLNMPYNIAACDSSDYSFSGGQLDHLTYFVSVDVERADAEDRILEPLFVLWFEEAARQYGWSGWDQLPSHSWDWPARPQIDVEKVANARKTSLSYGGTSLRRIYAEDGLDVEEELAAMAGDLGITVDDLRAKIADVIFAKGGTPTQQPPQNQNNQPANASDVLDRMLIRGRL